MSTGVTVKGLGIRANLSGTGHAEASGVVDLFFPGTPVFAADLCLASRYDTEPEYLLPSGADALSARLELLTEQFQMLAVRVDLPRVAGSGIACQFDGEFIAYRELDSGYWVSIPLHVDRLSPP